MSNAAKAKRIMVDVFHSGQIDSLQTHEIINVRDQLANLWQLIDGSEITAGMTETEVSIAIGQPFNTIGDVWYYPSTFSHHQYSIEFESGRVKATDFVTLLIS